MANKTALKIFLLLCVQIPAVVKAYAQQINPAGKNIAERFVPPPGYVRVNYAENSFQQYLRLYPLKKYNSPVLLYNGETKKNAVHVSVFAMPLLNTDLIQCADALIKLRAEYLYREKRFSDIVFTITNGESVPFKKYSEGYRPVISSNKVVWKDGGKKGSSRDVFDEYLKFIYIYAGTLSLARQAKNINLNQIRVGDFFIYGGSPGHVVMVLDLAEDIETGKKIMLLGQSYMPSQEFHVLKSFETISPWYYVRDGDLITPEWHFGTTGLMSFE
ncbi:DUF4846 domain-containing protein [Treponema maltophilum]